ncbi:MFS transporter [Halorhabdus sp. CBA1104]|nr:MFS transporter [Halorhabdus sp. CBA1104]
MLALFAFVTLDGALIQARGALVPTWKETFTTSETFLGLITPVGTVGFVAAMVVFGSASGRIDIKRALLAGIAVTAAAALLIGASPTFLLLLAFIGLRGFGTGIFRSLDRTVLSHLYPERRARIFSLHTMAWAIGATAGPLLVTAALWLSGWQLTYLVLALPLVPIFVILWGLDRPATLANEQSLSLADVRDLLGEPGIYGMALALLFVGSIESVFFQWLPYYATELFSRDVANLTLSIYLAAYVPGRFAFSRLAERYRFTDLVVAVGVILVGSLYAMLVLAEGLVVLGLVFVIGFFVSGLFPTLISMGIESRPSFTGPINVVANVAAQTGFFIAPATVGIVADATSIGTAMLLQIGLAVVLTIVALGLKVGPLGSRRSTASE